ncbi:chaplin [Streptomyces sp. NPDC058770]|uniref:chaplin n=1 Tax=Streptomyces sp. NPDC058770 TaxID=3346631 RepID=UPI0036930970
MRIRTAMAATAMAASAVLAGAGAAAADAGARGAAIGSPGVLSGNVIQLPLHVPINACGNSVNVIGVLNPTFGNTCANF